MDVSLTFISYFRLLIEYVNTLKTEIVFVSYSLHPVVSFNDSLVLCRLPTDVQAEAVPLILGGGDVLMAAETGSGKTGVSTHLFYSYLHMPTNAVCLMASRSLWGFLCLMICVYF